ncbi:MAG: HlyD family efflux transporter periplasmic adaptor subunit [Anaerobacillus sp.]|uniref:HlyD family efflux transporter periplasmic adaptor subunit n=1 Tax=Anaerobacillus sp. TaxID=1872506 RepID=UPI003919553E
MKLYTKEELKDARIFFDKSPPRFMSVFIIFLLIFLVGAIFIAHSVKKPYVVKAQGIVAVEGATYIASKGYGVITEMHANPGDYVREGDLLLVISSGNEGIQATLVKEQIDDLTDTLNVMDKYVKSLIDQKNTLSQTGKELEYYGKVKYYLDTVKQEKFEGNKSNIEINEKKNGLSELGEEIDKLQSELNQLKSKDDSDHSEKTEFENELEMKQSEKERLLIEIELLEQRLSSLVGAENEESINSSLQIELNEKKKELDKLDEKIVKVEAKLNNIFFNNEEYISKKAEIESNLELKQSEKKGLEEEIKQLEQLLETPYSQATQTLYQLLSELGQSRNQLTSKITELQANLGASEGQDAIHFVNATQSGELHYVLPLATGMSVQQNQILGEIASNGEDIYIDAYIQASDRSRVEVGKNVKVSIIGVNNYRFGSLSGVVDFIEPGTLQNESSDGAMVYYRARVRLEETSLKSKSGEVIELIRSMPVEARVVYEEETYLDWVMNLLNLKAK